ncbi:oxaloacetate decarboxylase [Aerococcus urinaehominis]|uniref:Oxaloacetate decarboxylase n=1 Tax=Aerococcus urinaehominis TaxID=128944 RepID=A0A120IB04_9LACT|nr:oxaloacetate decarboxylase subunit alpha [Aerococcus urinaehominis]AMB99744.1 oxaloacetate decarboxylase [Aerococcus urinaehominis]SDM10618.1 oxaloacetate decarboxylase, alpha subunit [Aerococcus urinaehominis]
MSKQIKIVETVLRDGHQSLAATRMSTEQMIPILEQMDQAGYYALECWGGATFDAALRFLNEDPWERLRLIRKHTPNTKLQMLLRGQNLLGYRNYPDDVVERFIQKSIENGIDIIRVFDALNDLRNLETAFAATKKYGGHLQATICFTTSEVHIDDYFVDLAVKMSRMGADSICVKDMAGILTPQRAYDLVSKIKAVVSLPLEVHTHATAGTVSMTYLKAIEAGCDIIDTAISPFAGGTSQPATESLHVALTEMGYDDGLDTDTLGEIADYFSGIRDDFRAEGLINPRVMEVVPETLLYQVPGGMLSNLLSQLDQAGQADKFTEVLKEVPRVRADLGYPPLVTPLSQMVGTQSVMNVLTGERYKMVPNEIKDYVKGYYGKSPAPISADIRQQIIGDEEVITQRPADLLAPGYDKAKQELGDLAESAEDVLSYIAFPQPALDFLNRRRDPWYDVPVQEVTVTLDPQ